MALPLTNITTTLVAQAIGLASNNVGVLCAGKLPAENISASRINKWSKYKPVILANPFPDRNGAWWRGGDNLCGFTIPSPHGVYTYNPPTGGTTAPFRISDYRGYNHAATIPSFQVNFPVKIDTDTVMIRIPYSVVNVDSSTLSFYDIIKGLIPADLAMYFKVKISNTSKSLNVVSSVSAVTDLNVASTYVDVSFTQAQITSLNMSVGDVVTCEVYLETSRGSYSCKLSAGTETIRSYTIESVITFKAFLNFTGVVSGSVATIKGTILLDATNKAGGTLSNGSYMYVYNNGNYSTILKTVTVPQGAVASNSTYTITVPAFTVDQIVSGNMLDLILYDSDNNYLGFTRIVM